MRPYAQKVEWAELPLQSSSFRLTHTECAVFFPRTGRRKRKRKTEAEERNRDRVGGEKETKKDTGRDRRRDGERQRWRERQRQRSGHRACADQVLPAGGRRVSEGALMGRDGQEAGGTHNQGPGCMQGCCQGHLPSRTGRGCRGRFPGGPEHCHPPRRRPRPGRGSPSTSGEHRSSSCRQRPAFWGQRTRGLRGPQTKGPFGGATADIFILQGAPRGATSRARPDFRLTRGSQLRATPIRAAAKPISGQNHLAGEPVLSSPGGLGSG